MSSPLEGLRVLDISNVIAGPFATALLGDFGAEVLKVELPGEGDALRSFPPQKAGQALMWKAINRNKKAITLDLRKPAGQALAPAGVFGSADGEWVTFTAATQNVFERFCALIGRAELASQPKYLNNAQRIKHAAELNAIAAEWIGARPCREAIRELSQAGVAAAPVYSNRDVAEDPHFRFREAITRVKDSDFGSVAVPCVVPRLSGTPGQARTSGPALGAHNAEVYGGWLGLSAADQAELRRAGVI